MDSATLRRARRAVALLATPCELQGHRVRCPLCECRVVDIEETRYSEPANYAVFRLQCRECAYAVSSNSFFVLKGWFY